MIDNNNIKSLKWLWYQEKLSTIIESSEVNKTMAIVESLSLKAIFYQVKNDLLSLPSHFKMELFRISLLSGSSAGKIKGPNIEISRYFGGLGDQKGLRPPLKWLLVMPVKSVIKQSKQGEKRSQFPSKLKTMVLCHQVPIAPNIPGELQTYTPREDDLWPIPWHLIFILESKTLNPGVLKDRFHIPNILNTLVKHRPE